MISYIYDEDNYNQAFSLMTVNCSDGRCVQRAMTYPKRSYDTHLLGTPCSWKQFQPTHPKHEGGSVIYPDLSA